MCISITKIIYCISPAINNLLEKIKKSFFWHSKYKSNNLTNF